MKKLIYTISIVALFVGMLMLLTGCTDNMEPSIPTAGNTQNVEDVENIEDVEDVGDFITQLENAEKVTVEEKIISLNKAYTIYVDGKEVATVSGKFIHITGDVFELKDNAGNVVAKEKQIRRWGIKLNRLAQIMDKNGKTTGYIGENVIKDLFSISRYKFHFYDANKNEYAHTKEQIISLFYTYHLYDNSEDKIFSIEKDFSFIRDKYTITRVKDSDVKMQDVVFLTCIVDAIKDAAESEE